MTALQVEGEVVTSWNRCIVLLLQNFFPRSASRLQVSAHSSPAPDLERGELVPCFAKLISRKSPGIDGVTGEMWKQVFRVAPEYVESVIQECLREGYFPRVWKVAKVVILLKSPERMRNSLSSYRGICLLPVLGKILERVLVERLQERVAHRLCPWQFGLSAGKSVEDAWWHMIKRIEDSTSKYVLGYLWILEGLLTI